MKYLKPYNEAAIDFLKPRSKEDLLDSVKDLTDQQKFSRGVEYNIDWLIDDSLEKMKTDCLYLTYKEYHLLLKYKEKLNFTNEEKKQINAVLNDSNSKNWYQYEDVKFLNTIRDSLVIKSSISYPIIYIDKFDKFITLYIRYETGRPNESFLLPKFDDLIKYINVNKLKAKKKNK